MTMQDAYQVMITLHLRAPNGHSNFYSTTRGTLRDTHRIHVYYVNGRVTHGPWNSWGTISWSWIGSECNIWKSMGQSWYEWYNICCEEWFNYVAGSIQHAFDHLLLPPVCLQEQSQKSFLDTHSKYLTYKQPVLVWWVAWVRGLERMDGWKKEWMHDG